MNQKTEFNPALVPYWVRSRIGIETWKAIQRSLKADPELWEKLDKRAAEIRERGEYGSGGGK